MASPPQCELCGSKPLLYCPADEAFLCRPCDERVHSANFIVLRHMRSMLCQGCLRDTGYRCQGSGANLQCLGSPAACGIACSPEAHQVPDPSLCWMERNLPLCGPCAAVSSSWAANRLKRKLAASFLPWQSAAMGIPVAEAVMGRSRSMNILHAQSQLCEQLPELKRARALPPCGTEAEGIGLPGSQVREVQHSRAQGHVPGRPVGAEKQLRASCDKQWLRLSVGDGTETPVMHKELGLGLSRSCSNGCSSSLESQTGLSGAQDASPSCRSEQPEESQECDEQGSAGGSTPCQMRCSQSSSSLQTPGAYATLCGNVDLRGSIASSVGSCSELRSEAVAQVGVLGKAAASVPWVLNATQGLDAGGSMTGSVSGSDQGPEGGVASLGGKGAASSCLVQEEVGGQEIPAPLGRPASSRLRRVLRSWSESLGGVGMGTQNLAYELFQRSLLRMKREEVAASFLRVTLASCLWLSMKLVELRAQVPGATEVAAVTAVDTASLRDTELRVLKLLDWQPLKYVTKAAKEAAGVRD